MTITPITLCDLGVTMHEYTYAGVPMIEIVVERDFDFAHGRLAEKEEQARWQEVLGPRGFTVEAMGHGTDRGKRFVRLLAAGQGEIDVTAPEYRRDKIIIDRMLADSTGD